MRFKVKAFLVLAALAGARVHAASEPVQMIQVDVQVLEINRSKLTKLGLDWERLLEGGPPLPNTPTSLRERFPPAISLGKFATELKLSEFDRGQVHAFISMLQENDYGKLLAKPKLLTASGSKASFLVGGEIPVITVGALGQVHVTWKEYGVKLNIQPTLRGKLIHTHVRAEASTVDPKFTVELLGGSYPALKTRWVESDVELASKATVIIAGLIQTEDLLVKKGLPLLSDLPLLGGIFRHTRTERIETELVIFVTPSLVSPQAGARGL